MIFKDKFLVRNEAKAGSQTDGPGRQVYWPGFFCGRIHFFKIYFLAGFVFLSQEWFFFGSTAAGLVFL